MSEGVSDVPADLLESVKDAVGRKTRLILKKKVKLEAKGDKLENKILALSFHRIYLLSTRLPSKVEQTFNYLELQGITSNKPVQLLLEFDRGLVSLKLASSEDVDEVLAHVGVRLQEICMSPARMMKKLSVEPPERMSHLQALWENVPEPGPCGGFSQTYKCVCDWLGLPYRDEVQWDVDTIYLTQDTRELNLQDFIHLENRDLVAILAVLEYNQWFTKLSIKDYKLSTDVCEQILRVVSRSSRLEELVLDNAGLKIDFAQKLASALALNPNSTLHTIILANNSLEDRGIAALTSQFAKMRAGLRHLNLSKTSLSPKGVNHLAQSLSASQVIPSTLTHLDLSGNVLRGDDLQNLYNFLSQPNNLVMLDLSNTDCSLDQVCASLLRGSVQHLSVLNMSKSIFPHRKGREIPPSFKQFFSSALVLSSVNVSGTKLPLEALKALLLGIACNPNLKDVSLDLSSCELRSGGSQILEGCIAEIPNISSLDISDNGLDSDLTTLLVWLAKNQSIRHLALGKNFNNIKSKNLAPVLDNLVHMIQEEESPLTSLSLADSKLKSDLTIVLNALGSNTSLTKVDISGNGMGDMGAKMLAKALQINTKLRTVIWDRNNVSPQGLQDVAAALEKNFTIRFMPIPIIDASQALKANPEKTEDALLRMESYLFRNHETRKYLQGQAYRLQQGIVTTTTQQVIDRVCVKVQDHLNSLRYTEKDAIQEDMKMAENVIKDARNSKRLLPNLYHLGATSREDVNGSFAGPIHAKLESMAGEVTDVMDEQLQTMLKSMVDAAEALCPCVMKKSHLRQELIKAGAGRMVVPRSFVKATLLEQSGVDIINKISDVKLTMASFLSDRIVDEVLESLSRSQHILAEHLARKGKPLQQQESLEAELQEEVAPVIANQEPVEVERLEDMDTCMMTPISKRKSIHSRMLRPVSRAFEMEFDLDKALEDVPIHIEDPPLPPRVETPPPPPTVETPPPEVMEELPSEEASKLEHYTKLRPKRNKKMKSSSMPNPISFQLTNSSPSQEDEQINPAARVDEGIDEFFSKKITKMGSKRSSLKSSSSQERDTKRESRKSGFLNLIMSRSSKHDKGQPAPAAPGPVATEEPLSPRSEPAKVTEPKAPPIEQGRAVDHPEELKVPDSVDHHLEGEGKASPMGGRRCRIQVMGTGLLAEMKAKQEKRAAGAHKMVNSPACAEKPTGSDPGRPAPPDSRPLGVPKGETVTGPSERPPMSDGKPEAAPRSRNPSCNLSPVSPKPPPLTSKPSLINRPSVPQKPRTSSSRSIDEHPETTSGNACPKASVLPYGPKRAPSDSEKECPSSLPLSVLEAAEPLGDGSPFDSDPEAERPAATVKLASLRQCSASAAEEVDEQERRKSLPRHERPASIADATVHLSGGSLSTEDGGPRTKDRDKNQASESAEAAEEPVKDILT
ncbi:F-actin-uncapping protein LRRC16A-like isoform X1 [Brienomyrus brachyistius]|uniref:F-actin-uncapping protein LRRC16A-like isoform X1 n=2 Tax=Brienomyrus brachyistius TaxID=42636 RepID=UPI0020B33372|nr:F-actin-uncapping protein LRRC16A-like isoform X1 [Brienomyrus brachyistius]